MRVNRTGPDNYWFGKRPDLLVDLRGEGVDALIDRVEAAVHDYPYPSSYRTWPGPNSNTFTAFVGRAVPELRLDLPPTAVGKDFLPGGAPVGFTPSGTGVQLSLVGLAGVLVGWEEGVELNLLGLTFGLDWNRPALKLPVLRPSRGRRRSHALTSHAARRERALDSRCENGSTRAGGRCEGFAVPL